MRQPRCRTPRALSLGPCAAPEPRLHRPYVRAAHVVRAPAGAQGRVLRVTGGALGGRTLVAPPGRSVRPTTDRVREAVFARLGDVSGTRALDLYAGTGALGIEALSRGAVACVFIERARPALSALRRNLEALGLGDRARVVSREVGATVSDLGRAGERFDLVFVDPPYDTGEDERSLRAALAAGILVEGAVVVVERSRRHALPAIAGLVLRDERRYGDTVVGRYAHEGGQAARGG